MGIQNFHQWLEKTYPTCFKKTSKNTVYDHIYLDLNYIFHNIIYGCSSEEDFVLDLFSKLDNLLKRYRALKTITFAIDGPSPNAKIKLQRKRRSMGCQNVDMSKINSLYLTPGTPLMNSLGKRMKQYVEERKDSMFKDVTSFIYPASDPDEGEIKLLSRLIKNGRKNINDSHLVVGNDSDLIAMTMCLIPVHNTDILIKQGYKYKIVSVHKLIKAHYRFVTEIKDSEPDPAMRNIMRDEFRSDFALIAFMMGNDYLPKMYYIKPETLWKSYIQARKTIINKNTTVSESCSEESSTEEDADKLTMVTDLEYNRPFLIEFLTNLIGLQSKQFKYMNLKKYKRTDVKGYMEGLLWCLHMYQKGKCSKYDYEYSNTAPSPMEILFYLKTHPDTKIRVPRSNVNPVSVDVYPLFVLPRVAIKLIPKNLHRYVKKELDYLYREEECKQCHMYRNDLSNYHKQLNLVNNDGDSEGIREQIGETSKLLDTHKKATHADDVFSINKVFKVIRKKKPQPKNILKNQG